MKFEVTVKQINGEFNKDYADQYNFGEESESNWKHLWSKTWGIRGDVKEWKVVENGAIILKNTSASTKSNSIVNIENVRILECTEVDGDKTYAGVSNSLLQKTYLPENIDYSKSYNYFYLKSDAHFIEIGPGLFIARKDLVAEINLKEENRLAVQEVICY